MRSRNGWGWSRALGGWLICLLPLCSGAEEIGAGVEVKLTSREAGVRSVAEVRIAPQRRPGQPPPDLVAPLVAAYDWCAGNVDNGFEAKWKGMDSRHGCDIQVDAGVYTMSDTAILRQKRGQRVPITIDLSGATILQRPETPRSVHVRELPTQRCDETTLGATLNVIDPESFDDFTHADPEGEVPIVRIGPNDRATPGCPGGGPVCKYGGNALRVETGRPHGLVDGGRFGLGDVVELKVPGTKYDGVRFLVKEVADPRTFLGTLDFAPVERATAGSMRETATTIWCNGQSWRAGKPMIALGGPGDSRKTRTTVRRAHFAFAVEPLYRTTAILVDGERAANGRGGAEWISVEDVTHVGNTALRGNVVVTLGTPHTDRNLCTGIDVDVASDHFPSSWSPAVWNQSCDSSRIRIRQHHGGGLWWGVDVPGYRGPRTGSVLGYVEGCKDGPCLWVRSGQLVLADGFKVWGSVNGPLGQTPGPMAGRVAILGTPGGVPVNVTSHGASWGPSPQSDLDCYVELANVSHFVQVGGYVLSGAAGKGRGDGWLFCAAPKGQAKDFVLEHVEEGAWHGAPRILRRSGR